ncbi:MAG: alpha/beta fold hydrolase [Thermodesulfobacteriota bacterium]
MPECTVQGCKIHYQAADKSVAGNMPALFVHGAGGSLHVWANQLQPNIPGFCQIALDLPGHARSQGGGEEYVQDYVQWIIGFIQAMGFEQCVLAGHSMGGAITQMAALHNPELFRAIVLVGTGARLRVAEDVLHKAWQGDSFANYAYAPDTARQLQQEAEKEFGLTPPEIRYYDFLACDRFDIMDRVQEIQPETLVICGQEDRLTPVKYSQYLHQHLPSSRLEIVPGAGHMVMWEQADAFNQVLQDFLLALVD